VSFAHALHNRLEIIYVCFCPWMECIPRHLKQNWVFLCNKSINELSFDGHGEEQKWDKRNKINGFGSRRLCVIRGVSVVLCEFCLAWRLSPMNGYQLRLGGCLQLKRLVTQGSRWGSI
jgi:hypothetical protein